MSDLPSFPPRPRRRSSLSQEILPDSLVEEIHRPSTDAVVEEDSASRNSSPKKMTFTLGSRSSQLALVQTHIVRDALQKLHPDYKFPIITMNTAGDKNQTQALYLLGGKALWTEELEESLQSGQIDIIVHSLKDIPTQLASEFTLGAVLERADPRDALVVKAGLESSYKTLADLPEGSVVGTSSVRRVAQLRRAYPGLKFMDMRGNLNTRLAKLDAPTSPFTALILAHAGLDRINLGHRSTSLIDPPSLLYAVGQGALGIEVRSADEVTKALVKEVNHWTTEWMVSAERGLLRKLEGGCSVPVGTKSEFVASTTTSSSDGEAKSGTLSLMGSVTSLEGDAHVVHEVREIKVTSKAECEKVGVELAEELIRLGAGELLKQIEEAKGKSGTVKKDDVIHG